METSSANTDAKVETLEQVLRQRKASGILLSYALGLLSTFSLSLGVLTYLDIQYRQTVYSTIFALIFFGIFLTMMVLKTKQPLTLFGFNLNRWKYNTFESIIYSILFCVLITLIKWILTITITPLEKIPLFDYGALAHLGMNQKANLTLLLIYAAIYTLFVPLQTFIAHGAVQSSVLNFSFLKHAKWWSILVATVFFAAIHASIDFVYALFMLIPGFFWAILYTRQRSLLGVMISHCIVGIWGLFILGYGQFLMAIEMLLRQ